MFMGNTNFGFVGQQILVSYDLAETLRKTGADEPIPLFSLPGARETIGERHDSTNSWLMICSCVAVVGHRRIASEAQQFDYALGIGAQ